MRFVLKLDKAYLATLSHQDILARFKLTKSLSTSSMYLYDHRGCIQHYRTPEDILEAFYAVRLAAYDDRKAHLLQRLSRKCIVLENKVRFVQCVLAGEVRWNQSEAEIGDILAARHILRLNLDADNLGLKGEREGDEKEEKEEEKGKKNEEVVVSYHYLLDMKIRSLTKENVEKLQKEFDETRAHHTCLAQTSTVDLWLQDLDAYSACAAASAAATAAAVAPEAETTKKTKPRKVVKK